MEEIEISANLYYTGNISTNRLGIYEVSNFSVWVEIAESDTDVTATLTEKQLQWAKLDFIEKYQEQLEAEEASKEKPLNRWEYERLHDCPSFY